MAIASRVASGPSLAAHRNRHPGRHVHTQAGQQTLATVDLRVFGGWQMRSRRAAGWPRAAASRWPQMASRYHAHSSGTPGLSTGHAWRTNSARCRRASSARTAARVGTSLPCGE